MYKKIVNLLLLIDEKYEHKLIIQNVFYAAKCPKKWLYPPTQKIENQVEHASHLALDHVRNI